MGAGGVEPCQAELCTGFPQTKLGSKTPQEWLADGISLFGMTLTSSFGQEKRLQQVYKDPVCAGHGTGPTKDTLEERRWPYPSGPDCVVREQQSLTIRFEAI